ncbi:MAG: hypothetical protein NTW87_11895 [Planctomycetota bacterium]|nr:hypothetical protein [Planctomycetota bacterium]
MSLNIQPLRDPLRPIPVGTFGPVAIEGRTAYGFTTKGLDDGHGGTREVRLINFGDEIGRRDLEGGVFRLNPLRTGGFRLGKLSDNGDTLKTF